MPAASAASSRFVSSRHDVPTLDHGLESFSTAVQQAVKESGAEVVFVGGDGEVYALAIESERIPAIVPSPCEEVVWRAFDKLELCQSAVRAGLAAPWTVEAGADILQDVGLAERLDGRLVVKSRWHWDPRKGDSPTRSEASLETGAAAIAARVAELRERGAAPLLQETIMGDHLSVIVLRGRDGRTLGTVYQQIDHRWPQPAGWTVRAHTLEPDPALECAVGRLLADLDWVGLVELEFIRPDDGIPRLIDFNGRYYGSMQLAVSAGVDFPALWAADATGRAVEPAPPARVGVRFQRLGGDMRRAVSERSNGLWHDVANTLSFAQGASHSILRVKDPRPAFVYLRTTAQTFRRPTPK